jgi:hypothetical protein
VTVVAIPRDEAASVLRRVGRAELVDELERDYPEQLDEQDLFRFAEKHGLSRESLAERMGGSP